MVRMPSYRINKAIRFSPAQRLATHGFRGCHSRLLQVFLVNRCGIVQTFPFQFLSVAQLLSVSQTIPSKPTHIKIDPKSVHQIAVLEAESSFWVKQQKVIGNDPKEDESLPVVHEGFFRCLLQVGEIVVFVHFKEILFAEQLNRFAGQYARLRCVGRVRAFRTRFQLIVFGPLLNLLLQIVYCLSFAMTQEQFGAQVDLPFVLGGKVS